MALRYAWAVHQELLDLIGTHDFDVINFPEWGAEGFAYLVNRQHAGYVPAVVHLHGPLSMFSERIGWPDRTSMLYQLGTAMEDASIRLADGLMASSAHIADFVAARHNIDRASIDVVHSGIDCNLFRPSDSDKPRSPTVLFVGNIARNKGVTFLLDAVLHLRRRYPDIRLRVIGSGDAQLVESFRRRARRENAEENLELCGFVPRDRLPGFYRDADVFASPAEYELGVANVYIEAMACGCPVIASTAGGAREAVEHDVTGMLVAPGDIDALVHAIDHIVSTPSIRKQMGAVARRRVEEYFALDRYIARVLASYEKAVARVRASAGA
jgi:glycosyltransferase involved in cell wall biosynthesis